MTAKRSLQTVDWLLLALFVSLALAHASYFNHTCDDAYISFRYCHNLASGDGLVFNAGERVMGYSNLLWVLMLAGLESLGITAPIGARVLGILFSGLTLVRVFLYLWRSHGDRLATIAPVAMLAANATFSLWILGGLEGPLLAFVLTSGCVAAMRLNQDSPTSAYARTALWFGLAAITRPEAVAYIAPVGLLLALRHPGAPRLRRVSILVGLVGLIYALAALWIFVYYGDWLPNTYYAKWHPLSLALLQRGATFSLHFLADYYFVPLAIVLAWAAVTRLSLSSAGWFPAGILTVFLLYFLRIGGDALVYHRMWMWMMPMFALLLGEVLATMRTSGAWLGRKSVAIAIATLVVALNLPLSLAGDRLEYQRRDDAFVRDLHLIGDYLARSTPETTIVAANMIGVIGFKSERPILDMLGLTDRHIARAPGKRLGIPGHESHDGRYVLDQMPDIILWCLPQAVPFPDPRRDFAQCIYPSAMDLKRDPRLATMYRLRYAQLADGRYMMFLERTPS